VRTTLDLPDDIHELARQVAHDSGRSLSEVVSELIRLGLRRQRPEPARSVRGIPMTSVGRPVTAEDVRALDDDG
jgi:hypothetical protein